MCPIPRMSAKENLEMKEILKVSISGSMAKGWGKILSGKIPRKKRDFRSTDAVLDKYGETPGCVGCQAKLEGKGQRGHTKDCRDRIEKAMAAAEEDLEKLVERDLRLDRYKKKAPVPPANVEEEEPVPAQQPEASSSSNEVPTHLQVGTTRERETQKEKRAKRPMPREGEQLWLLRSALWGEGEPSK